MVTIKVYSYMSQASNLNRFPSLPALLKKLREFFAGIIGTRANEMPRVVEGTRNIMGTAVTITVVHPHVDEAKEAVGLAFDEMRKIESLMSIQKEDSEVSILNKNGFIENASAEVIYVVKKAIHYSMFSGGAFSITILPVLDLWEEKLKAGRYPTDEEIIKALELADYRNIRIDDGNIRFLRSGMRATLGGIAKGYAVDKAIKTLKQKGIKHALVNAGGDIRVVGEKVKGFPWRVAVRDPRDKKQFVTIVKLCDRAIATSGSYERFIGEGIKVSHIIDARNGKPVQNLLSATVIAKSAIDADALSTIVFLLGAEKGLKLIKGLNNVEALVVTKEGEIIKSDGFHRYEVQLQGKANALGNYELY